MLNRKLGLASTLLVSLIIACKKDQQPSTDSKDSVELLNVSYDPTRELYQEINKIFIDHWKSKTGQTVVIKQSHGGAGKQARAIIDGLQGDVATLALAYDIDEIAQRAQLMPPDWQKRLPNNSCPYTSTIVFVVNKGNPKNIKDWDDLIRDHVAVITPNPKTSGGARWNYLAAWGYALRKFNGDEAKVREFVGKMFKRVPVLDSGARGSTTTFVQRGIGDVLIAWENEAFLIMKEFGQGKMEIVVPSISILAEPPITLLDKIAASHGTTEVAQAYLEYLYTEDAQRIIAKHNYRPTVESVVQEVRGQFPEVELLTIDKDFGGWANAQKTHFADKGVFDEIYQPAK